ncbi:MAG: putative ABC exporter domain-containing protein [Gemmatimonadaceae bacterium]|nr:putative ABC exporter domain-containing protein [Gemmatimonadaceae bacterium]
MNGALWYLVAETTRNQWRARVARLRNPRYALALVLGVAYFWFLYLRPQRSAQGPHEGDLSAGFLNAMGTAASLLIVLYTAWTWIFGGDRTALAFSEAEVSLLFPAPLSRRALIGYKLLKAQLPILFTAVLWVVLMRRSMGPMPPALRVVSIYVMLTTINLHRLAAALVNANALEHGARGARRTMLALVVFAIVLGSIGWALWGAHGAFDDGMGDGMRAVVSALRAPPASVALYPFAVVLAPVFAASISEWWFAMGPAVVLLVLHVWWVLRSDAAFEESAVAASVALAKKLAALRGRQGGAVAIPSSKGVRRSLPLAPVGAPAVAIVWKNLLWLMRSGTLRAFLIPAALAMVLLVVLHGKPDILAPMLLAIGGVTTVALLLFGPVTLRNDLRSDLLHLPLLKTLPLHGYQVVLAQVASGAIPVAAAQYLTGLVAIVGLYGTPMAAKWNTSVVIGGMVAAPLLLLGLNGTTFLIHNAMALLFPGWVKLGEHGVGGPEAMGQSIMTMMVVALCLALALLLPAASGAVLFFALRGDLFVAVAAAGSVAGVVLGAQCYGLIARLGVAFERVEPQQVG